ncbi:MAG: pyridoxamine 5'-phosphate oxidase family protein [Streptosporangiaceae bacterium]
MTTPVTALDPRYSDPSAAPVGWEETRRLLEAAELSWISTVRADGRPHVTPLVAAWVEGAVYFHTGAEEQKFANLRANPHVVLTTGCNRWDEGIDVVVEGAAVHVTDEKLLTRVALACGLAPGAAVLIVAWAGQGVAGALPPRCRTSPSPWAAPSG